MLPLFRKSDMLVLPSRSEGMPNVILEAWSQKLGVVSTSVGGVPEMIEHQQSGLLAPPEKPELLAEHLMTPDVLTTHPEESLADAVDRLVSNRVHRLVVTKEQEPKRPIGILSLTDLATAGPMIE